ncbi:MAG: acetyl-CoA carboxylase biotin carboxylase subunit [Thermodesulfobacteriota bacterium]
MKLKHRLPYRFKKIFVANRGEIALRIIRACREMEILSVAAFSDADRNSLPVKMADEAANIGSALSRKSYLNIENILKAAHDSGADAIHPGYGFLSENPLFAKACKEASIKFIGPSPECLAAAGDKSAAREKLKLLGIPIIPGSDGIIRSSDQAEQVSEEIGYPIIIKASGGGGGRGMRIVRGAHELPEALKTASGEARAAFGNPDVYIEKYFEKPRHIEVQILRDYFGNQIHLFERECSIQKRHQKLIEESPSPCVDVAFREKICETALKIAESIRYTNAGTIEFLVDQEKKFYFMEVNARIQVEHPVTEMVTGVDLVAEQIRIARGEALGLKQADIRLDGWALECRINAENPEDGFMPSPGTVRNLILPGGPGIRLDTHLFTGYDVPPYYDSLICKAIAWGKNRNEAISRMKRALHEFKIEGIHMTIPFHQEILTNHNFLKGEIHTQFLKEWKGL